MRKTFTGFKCHGKAGQSFWIHRNECICLCLVVCIFTCNVKARPANVTGSCISIWWAQRVLYKLMSVFLLLTISVPIAACLSDSSQCSFLYLSILQNHLFTCIYRFKGTCDCFGIAILILNSYWQPLKDFEFPWLLWPQNLPHFVEGNAWNSATFGVHLE